MQTKTWPYGTQKRVELLDSRITKIKGVGFQIVVDDQKEAFVLMGESCCDFTAEVGSRGVITFMQGGPTGGYWKFVGYHHAPPPASP
ncbi:MAG: hypothetical protein KGL39_02845 [Patescibacteria group bacterium]|nr:hypothetical protein [Patescibacteria group bacterium]